MKLRFTIFILALAAVAGLGAQPRTELTLDGTWEFHRGAPAADAEWQEVTVPHDWAIYGPFVRTNDLQSVALIQNGETEESEKTGRTGGLPYFGQGQYRRTFTLSDTGGKCVELLFDGAMSEPKVYVNGQKAGEWAYGYTPFSLDISRLVHDGENTIYVELQNLPQSAR